MTYNPRHETKKQLLRVWEAWLSPKSRWLKALRAASPDTVFHDWGMGLPGRSHGLMPDTADEAPTETPPPGSGRLWARLGMYLEHHPKHNIIHIDNIKCQCAPTPRYNSEDSE